ncbi:MAG TPA: hypothetical protein VNA04_11715 [Thermoanaerobaculia bacterium]|nr:hypothetical protein [Thermoanaerobaculia bacterium]
MIARLAVLAIVAVTLPAPAATMKRLDGGPQPIVARPAGPAVTLDVKDAEATVVLKEMQKQCGIRNLMIDPDVKVKGTFYFHEVPCTQAWNVVLRSLGLDVRTYSSSIVAVTRQTNR